MVKINKNFKHISLLIKNNFLVSIDNKYSNTSWQTGSSIMTSSSIHTKQSLLIVI